MSNIRIDTVGPPQHIPASDGTVTIVVPIRIKRRGNRKVVISPDGEQLKPRLWDRRPTPVQQALVRGHRWLRMVEAGEVDSLTELAKREGMDRAYVSRMVNLTTLAPDIVAAIFEENLPANLTLFELASATPLLWDEQRALFGMGSACNQAQQT